MHLFLSIKYGDKGIKEIKSTAPSLEIYSFSRSLLQSLPGIVISFDILKTIDW